MANERKGVAYEAIVYLALQELHAAGALNGPVHWNVRPGGMTIDPDFTIGEDPNKPLQILLVSHCGSTGNSHMKSWRNLGELGEAKTLLDFQPEVFCLTFGLFKEELTKLQAAAFDGFEYVSADLEPAALKTAVADLKSIKRLRKETLDGNIQLSSSLSIWMKGKIKKLLSGKNLEISKLWDEHSLRSVPVSRAPIPSGVRRGTAKLLAFPNWELAKRLFHDKKATDGPQVLSDLGITRSFGGKLMPYDKELIDLFSRTPLTTLKMLYENDWGVSVARMAGVLRNPSRLAGVEKYFRDNKTSLTKANTLLPILNGKYIKIGEGLGLQSEDGNWVFDFFLSIVRAARGAQNAFGYAQLAKEIIDADGFGVALSDESKKLLLSPWGNLSEWSSGDLDLEDEIVKAIAAALVDAVHGVKDWSATVAEAKKLYLRTYLEAKLACHRSLDPVGFQIRASIVGSTRRIPTCFAERIGSNRSGRTECYIASKTLIKWQSCSDAGREHKKKELCGRGIGLRYHWTGSSFIRRPNVEKMFLVLDGSWQQDDINSLLHAAWDDVYYPDEIDKMIKAIV